MFETGILRYVDYQVFVTVVMVLVALKWGDWRNWRIYYPTMLFFAAGDFIYGLLTYNFPLWEFESPFLKTTFSDLLIASVFYPATLLVFLPRFPEGLKKRIGYVFIWVAIYTIIEHMSYLLGFFSYHNGWTIWWSILFNFGMFPLLYIHHKKPLWAIFIAGVGLVFALVYFNVPISSMK